MRLCANLLWFDLGRSVDADGHILEPPDLWQKNLENKFKDRALGLARDENGVESFIVNGHFSAISRGLGIAAAFGQPGEVAFSNEFSYMDGPPGAYDSHARVKLLDEEGIDAAVLYPTLGLLWEARLTTLNSPWRTAESTTTGSLPGVVRIQTDSTL